ncbi:MAG: sensor histidine kinase KdpD [Caldilineaceae bacterium]|nr:sensor histidine kinase KdpD [Caldilineaceae bacterium]
MQQERHNAAHPPPDPRLLGARPRRGKLKIFFGMAPGVGKTYAMLLAAQERVAEGVDVVVGYVETHGRPETAALLASLPVIPRQRLSYRDFAQHDLLLEEMDLDAILARRPQLVLVDELAHTNLHASDQLPRHRKRYQDVIELLDTGIDVYTTVNVQHFASRADAVAQITGITVTETIPDSLLELADEIELIDLSPEELRKRLAEGKVYTPEGAASAATNFFRTGNLTALREMALRLTAEHVDHQLQDYMQAKQIAGPWKSRERLMVAVGPSPYSGQLIRWTRRMAYTLEAPWLAATVETAKPLTPEAQQWLAHNLTLARELGGEVIHAAGEAVDKALLQLAQHHNVTQIVIGKPLHSPLQTLLRGGSLVDNLIRNSGDIDIYVVTGEDGKPQPPQLAWLQRYALGSAGRAYLLAVVVMALVTALNWSILQMLPWLEYQVVGLTDLLTVLLIAIYLGRGPAILAATLSAFTFNFFFVEPHYTFVVTRFQDLVLIGLYFLIAIFAGSLTARIRQQEQLAQRNVQRIMSLYRLARETATAADLDAVLQTAVVQLQQSFGADVAILLAADGKLQREPQPASTLPIDDKTFQVADWAFVHGRPAGRFTDTLPAAIAHFVPLRTPDRIAGVIGLRLYNEQQFTFDQALQLETFVNQIALVVERQLLDGAARQSALLQESERLHTTLLNSISHELRTPLATITGVVDLLQRATTDADTRQALLSDLQDAAQRLNQLVENLLDMSRLDAGRLQIKRDWCVVSDVVGVAVQRLHSCLSQRPLTLAIPPDLPLVQMDFVLMEQVLINLLHNICNYTPPGTPVEISAKIADEWLWLTVADHGPGIPPALLERIFDKFYRLPGTATGGTGLGLSICRGLVHAHGGELSAHNRPSGGAVFTIQLPAGETPPPVKEADFA